MWLQYYLGYNVYRYTTALCFNRDTSGICLDFHSCLLQLADRLCGIITDTKSILKIFKVLL